MNVKSIRDYPGGNHRLGRWIQMTLSGLTDCTSSAWDLFRNQNLSQLSDYPREYNIIVESQYPVPLIMPRLRSGLVCMVVSNDDISSFHVDSMEYNQIIFSVPRPEADQVVEISIGQNDQDFVYNTYRVDSQDLYSVCGFRLIIPYVGPFGIPEHEDYDVVSWLPPLQSFRNQIGINLIPHNNYDIQVLSVHDRVSKGPDGYDYYHHYVTDMPTVTVNSEMLQSEMLNQIVANNDGPRSLTYNLQPITLSKDDYSVTATVYNESVRDELDQINDKVYHVRSPYSVGYGSGSTDDLLIPLDGVPLTSSIDQLRTALMQGNADFRVTSFIGAGVALLTTDGTLVANRGGDGIWFKPNDIGPIPAYLLPPVESYGVVENNVIETDITQLILNG